MKQSLRRNGKDGILSFFVLPLCSPKLNEYAEGAHTEKFYKAIESSFELPKLRAELLEWERTYNTIRLHQALDYITLFKFLEQCHSFTLIDVEPASKNS